MWGLALLFVSWRPVDAQQVTSTMTLRRVPFCESNACDAAEVFEWAPGLNIMEAKLSVNVIAGDLKDGDEFATLWIGTDATSSAQIGFVCRTITSCPSTPEPCLDAYDISNVIGSDSTSLYVEFQTPNKVSVTSCSLALEFLLELVYTAFSLPAPPPAPTNAFTLRRVPFCESNACDAAEVFDWVPGLNITTATLTVNVIAGDLEEGDEFAILRIGTDDTTLTSIGYCRTSRECPSTPEPCLAAYDVTNFIGGDSAVALFVEFQTPNKVSVTSCSLALEFLLEIVYTASSLPAPPPAPTNAFTLRRVPFCESNACDAAEVFDWVPGLNITTATLTVNVIAGDLEEGDEFAILRIGTDDTTLTSIGYCRTSRECPSTPESCLAAYDVTNFIGGDSAAALYVDFQTSRKVSVTSCSPALEFLLEVVYEEPPPDGMISESSIALSETQSAIATCSTTGCDAESLIALNEPVAGARLSVNIVVGDLNEGEEFAVVQVGADGTNFHSIAACRTKDRCPVTKETCLDNYDVLWHIARSTDNMLYVKFQTPRDVSVTSCIVVVEFLLEYVPAGSLTTPVPSISPSSTSPSLSPSSTSPSSTSPSVSPSPTSLSFRPSSFPSSSPSSTPPSLTPSFLPSVASAEITVSSGTELIDAVEAGVERRIFVAASVVTLGETVRVASETVIFGSGRDDTAIDGNNAVRLFEVTARLRLDDVSLRRSFHAVGAGAIYVASFARLELHNCLVVQNTAAQDGNTFGGALYVDANGAIEARNCEFRSNLARHTGGVQLVTEHSRGGVAYLNSFATFVAVDCVFTTNLVSGWCFTEGAVLYAVTNAKFEGIRTDFVDNEADYDTLNLGLCQDYGGVAYLLGATFSCEQCTIQGNRARSDGGAFYLTDGAHLSCVDCVLDQNLANINDGSRTMWLSDASTVFLRNSYSDNGVTFGDSASTIEYCDLRGPLASAVAGSTTAQVNEVCPPTVGPTDAPTTLPPSTATPTAGATLPPSTATPTAGSSTKPSLMPTTTAPTRSSTTTGPTRSSTTTDPSLEPTGTPSYNPTSSMPTGAPSFKPTTSVPSAAPIPGATSLAPSILPSSTPPSLRPTMLTTTTPTLRAPDPTSSPTSLPNSFTLRRVAFCESDGCSASEVFDWAPGFMITRARLSASIVSGDLSDGNSFAILWSGANAASRYKIGSCLISTGCPSTPEPCPDTYDVSSDIGDSTFYVEFEALNVTVTSCVVAIEFVLELVYEDPVPRGMFSDPTAVGAEPQSISVQCRTYGCDADASFVFDGLVASARLLALVDGDLDDARELALLQIGGDNTTFSTIAACRTITPCVQITCLGGYDVLWHITGGGSSAPSNDVSELYVKVQIPDAVTGTCGSNDTIVTVTFLLVYALAPPPPTSLPSPSPSNTPTRFPTAAPTTSRPSPSPTSRPTPRPTPSPSLGGPAVSTLVLVDAVTDTDIAPILEGSNAHPTVDFTKVNIRAVVVEPVGSVCFSGFVTRTENVAPYAAFGDDGGDFRLGTIPVDQLLELTATPYRAVNCTGDVGTPLEISFIFI